ncbi:polysaccharide lyase 6 family protein [Catenovulum adriaticum]|uniref:Polysaccharide lyase 6 family protein n=1 Tax=Catenovulum adriaticum TaxID=2984846 RepID=A0ABY7AS50_9ALTE|nr:polysaccharide lyase 6 family protein [Catenovulum sp. TS8]WAJ72150.1 polysaccharide lyase 6 family protein [Catenovulum sp. TS8]
MKICMKKSQLLVSSALCLFSSFVFAADYKVSNQADYEQAVKKLSAGDTVILANGEWKNFEIVFKGQGTKDKPITLKAQNKGQVLLTGQSNLRLAGEHLVVSGLTFKNGYTPSNSVISFKYNDKELANHSRVTEVVIDEFSNPDRFESDYWVALYGQHNRFDHSFLRGKRNKGVTMAVRLNNEASQQNHHLIDHNYFGPRPVFGSNGGETLRIGTSHYSLSDSFTRVENNYFDRCDGEVEIISVKSGKNQIKNNVFFESRGTLTLRHGNGNLIENNVFFGNGVDHTGGIRVINRDQTVRNNYLADLTGYRFGSGFTIMNGVPNSPINRYHQVVNATVENNTLVNVENIYLGAGSDSERTATPKNSSFSNNLIINQNNQSPFTLLDDISGITFNNNLVNFKPTQIKQGLVQQELNLTQDANGLSVLRNTSVGAKLERVLAKEDTGPTWYSKADLAKPFNSGKLISIKPADSVLSDTLKNAQSGDVIELASGEYIARKILAVDKTITFKAANNANVVIYPQRSSLFEIQNKGSLKLDGITLSGRYSPDSSGNMLIRTQKWGMYNNYQFVMNNSKVMNLDVNHSYHFFDAGARSFADLIEVTNSEFSNITGDLFRLNQETDDLGIYNAEYVVLKNNEFKKVQGALLDLYRGGTDESTFGPHLAMHNNQISQVGSGKRNKLQASIRLHGVQVSVVEDNQFENSALIKVEHTVGDPITVIRNNEFAKTKAPKAVELVFDQAPTATIEDNEFK